MKALICLKPGELVYQDLATDTTRDEYTLLRVKRIGICGTDLHAFEGTQPFFKYPRILGHELAAEIAETNDTGFKKGEAVTFIPYFNCGVCIACRSNKPNCCVSIQVCGVHIDGGMREFLRVPSSSLVKSQGLSFDELALVEPMAIGAHAVNRAGVKPDEFVLVIGAGPIGLGVAEFARIAGGKVIVMDVNSTRLNFCKERLSINHVLNAGTGAVMEQLNELTGGEMPTVVIDATGNLKAINNGFQYMAHSGRYVLVGLQMQEISFSHPEFHKREATLMSSRNATRGDFDHVIASMKNKLVNPATYITHHVQFDEVKHKFESWLKPETGVIKAMVTME